MTDIVVPTLGESVSEATVAKWMKKAGDAVKKDETLVELETDKVSVEVSAPEAGVLSEIVASEGATVEHRRAARPHGRSRGATAPSAPKAEAPQTSSRGAAGGRRRSPPATALRQASAAIGATHRR